MPAKFRPRLYLNHLRFNGRLRDECLNETLFSSLRDARTKFEAWRHDFSEVRPHSSLGYLTPGGSAASPPGALRYARAPRTGLLLPINKTDQITSGLSLRLDDKWGSRQLGRIRGFK